MGHLAPFLISLLLLAVAVPGAAEHVAPSEIRWACGFGGSGSTGHPSNCGINPVGGGFDVGAAGSAVWGDSWTTKDEPVLGFQVAGDARAIPIVMLDNHEIANINIGNQALAITYCPLCGSGVAFVRDVVIDGQTETLTFAASGFLYQSDLVMWDPQTETLWNQISGAAIGTLVGETVNRAHQDLLLETWPMVVTTWAEWLDAHPEAVMLQKVHASYSNPYRGYASDDSRCGLEACRGVDARLHPKDLVIAVTQPQAAAFSVRELASYGNSLVFPVGDRVLVVTTTPAGGHRVLDATGVGLDNSTGSWLDAEGDVWDLQANRDTGGDVLPEVPSLRLFWFAWAEQHSDTVLWAPASSAEGPILEDNGKLPGFTIPIVGAFLLLGALAFRLSRR